MLLKNTEIILYGFIKINLVEPKSYFWQSCITFEEEVVTGLSSFRNPTRAANTADFRAPFMSLQVKFCQKRPILCSKGNLIGFYERAWWFFHWILMLLAFYGLFVPAEYSIFRTLSGPELFWVKFKIFSKQAISLSFNLNPFLAH